MTLALLSERMAGAAENMATDFLLLQRAELTTPCLRHYGWHRPAFTFGYSQRLEFVQSQLPPDEPVELCRRPTGGGLVDHRNDWTYALVVPRPHPLYELRAIESYRTVHASLTAALLAMGCPAGLQETCEPCDPEAEPGPAGVCFVRPELYDVVRTDRPEKIAGAAQKRTRRGLLLQGSIHRAAAGPVDWAAFSDAFAESLARAIGATAKPATWPELSDEELAALTEQYASPEWNGHR